MRFKKGVMLRLDKLEMKVLVLEEHLRRKDGEVERLANQNTDLMNRFMATKWDQYATMNPEHWKGEKIQTFVNGSPLTDTSNAGEVLSDEDIKLSQ